MKPTKWFHVHQMVPIVVEDLKTIHRYMLSIGFCGHLFYQLLSQKHLKLIAKNSRHNGGGGVASRKSVPFLYFPFVLNMQKKATRSLGMFNIVILYPSFENIMGFAKT